MKPNQLPAIVLAACAASQPMLARAHHAMDGALPGSVFEGFVSGLAHPVIGLDHFLFVLALGAVCFQFGRRVLGIGAFLVAALAGTMLHVYQVSLPYAEIWVAGTLVCLGIAVLRSAPALRGIAASLFFGAAGVVHGYAYGESIVGAETAPLLAYLAGFTTIQFAVGLAGFAAARHADRLQRSAAMLRTVGVAASFAGVAFLLMALAG